MFIVWWKIRGQNFVLRIELLCRAKMKIGDSASLNCYHICVDEASAKEEAQRHIEDGSLPYTKADVVGKLGGWDIGYARDVAQGCLSALKQLTLSDKQLAGKKSLYIRLGCRGDWPNIKPPGWDPAGKRSRSLFSILTKSICNEMAACCPFN